MALSFNAAQNPVQANQATGSSNREPAVAFINLSFAGVDCARFGLAITASDLAKNPELGKLVEYASQMAAQEGRNRFEIKGGLTANLSLNQNVARTNDTQFDPSMLG